MSADPVLMDDVSTGSFHWSATPRHWFFEGGAVPVTVLLPLTVLLSFFSADAASAPGTCAVLWIACFARSWVPAWTAVVDVRVETGGRRRLLLRQRYGRTRTYSLDSVTAVRPLQVGPAFWVDVKPGQDDEYKDSDEMVLQLHVGGTIYTTYNNKRYTEARMAPLVTALRRACPNAVVAETEFRRPTYIDVERGMSPG